jgi:hypothetical protein
VADNLFDYNYKTPIVTTGGTVSNTAVSGVGGYKEGITTTANDDARTLYNLPEADRKILAQRLKNAGYKVAVTGKFSDKLLAAYQTASMKAALQSQYIGQPFTVAQYLDQEAAARVAEGGAGGGPSVRRETRISDQTTAKALIDAIFKDTLGRKASSKEILKYTKAIQTAQKASPTVTTYSTSGGVTSATTTGGINEQQYLIDQIAGTDEAKANQVLGYYQTFMNALGGR